MILNKSINAGRIAAFCAIGILFAATQTTHAQRRGGVAGPPTLGLTNGLLELETPDFNIKLVKDSQTLAALEPKGVAGYDFTPRGRGRRGAASTNVIHEAFDFTPADQLTNRQANRFYHFGDLTFRLSTDHAESWSNYSTAAARQPVLALPVVAPALASADLSATLPDNCPLLVIRTWTVENGRLVLKFNVKNKSDAPVEIGALGIPLIFNNNAGYDGDKGRVQALSAFSDPAIGMDGGYVQV
ncbi:MAG: DUF5695 domain-containing protein, partial [Bryobacteraceae bacterium]